ncbi:Uncharacterised protein [Legionella pneumophila]|nr:Uncharacterised protein [Legionella pneumophila]
MFLMKVFRINYMTELKTFFNKEIGVFVSPVDNISLSRLNSYLYASDRPPCLDICYEA